MEITPLINNFSNYWPLDEAAIKAIQRIVRHQSLKRRACILQEGEECHHFTFVVEGCLRMYKVDDKGNVHNLQFAIENDWIADYSSFYDETPSELYIDALEPTQLFQIEKKRPCFNYTITFRFLTGIFESSLKIRSLNNKIDCYRPLVLQLKIATLIFSVNTLNCLTGFPMFK